MRISGWSSDVCSSDLPAGSDEVEFDNPGWFGALSLGYDFGWPRIELEGSFRNNDPKGGSELGSSIDTYGLMANVLVDLDFGFPVLPYIGAGAGAAYVAQIGRASWRGRGCPYG